jgi:hypothetical protein
MPWLHMVSAALLLAGSSVEAGCIGPVILGECHGKEVPWDTGTHGTDVRDEKVELGLPDPDRTAGRTPAPTGPGMDGRRGPATSIDRLDPREPKEIAPRDYPGRFR